VIGKPTRNDVEARAWLLEIRGWKDRPPTYLRDDWDAEAQFDHMGWLVLDGRTITTDPNYAKRFEHQGTAEIVADALKGGRFVATEHMWMKP
jgi:hypothetical protein